MDPVMSSVTLPMPPVPAVAMPPTQPSSDVALPLGAVDPDEQKQGHVPGSWTGPYDFALINLLP
ncbi:hypothetical protein SAMN05428966_12233 [Massilia sp. PDC64]|jgi:hypothetical protein|nr:hypothetical protein SAMN05428966_12233 [Massilia sp. PDC64]